MSIEKIIKSLKDDHKELYEKLDYFMGEFTKVKKVKDNKHLHETTVSFLAYVEALLNEHFLQEEEIFGELVKRSKTTAEMAQRLLKDHKEIEEKYKSIGLALKSLDEAKLEDYDLTESVLYPSYNLIATLSHHADREDKSIFSC